MPKPTTPSATSASSAIAALASRRNRSRAVGAESTRNANNSPAVSLMPTPPARAAIPPRTRGELPAVNASASAVSSITSVSLWAPPTAITSSTGLSPTNAAAQRPSCPSRLAARAISAIAARLDAPATALNAHSPVASENGAVR
jgi:hypothetical protein